MPDETEPEDTHPVAELVSTLKRERDAVRRRHMDGASGIEVTRRLSDLVDRLVVSMFNLAVERVPGAVAEPSICLVAAGGYGRRRLAPFSDIDMTFIVAHEDDPVLDGIAREMFFLITDVLTEGVGLRIGYAYRPLGEIEDLDIASQTALLDARLVCGDRALFYRFREELLRSIQPAVFAWTKIHEREEALHESGDSLYYLEPNVKMGAGGLRDLHTAEWLAKVTMGVGLQDPWGRLRIGGYISEEEFQSVTAGRDYLLRLRNGLHWMTDEALDIVLRDRQAEIAAQLGFAGDGKRTPVDQMMEEYYRHAASIRRISRKAAAKCMKQSLRLDTGFVIKAGQVTPTDVTLLEREPSAALRVLYHTQCYDFPLSPEVEVMISDFASGAEGALDDIESRRIFLQILRHPHRVYATLKRMADLEVLPRVIPAYQALLRLLPTEAVHQFTVGEHSLRVVEALEQSRAESETTGSIFRQAWNHVNSPEVLMLAALLHDVGKIRRSEHHAEVGAEIARSVAFQLGLEEESIQHLAFLVKNHDLLADFTRLRQPDQPGATAEITEVTKTPERLAMLFLLACADVRTMGNDTGIHVQIENLVQLYRTITSTPPGESDQTESEGIQEGVRALEESLSVRHLPETAVRSFIAAMPAGYLLNTDVDRIAAHIMAVDRLENEPVVDFREDRRRLWTVMTVIALDAPGLLSKIAGVLFAHDVNVHSARVFTREGERPIALDELVVEAHNKPLTFDVQVAVERDLRRVLAGEVSAADVMAEYGRRLDSCTPVRSVRLHNDLSESFTVVEIEMPDEKGLVCRLATALTSFGWDIHNARITTRAGTARIVFYVTDVSHRKIETDTLDPLMMLTEGMSAAE